MYRASSLLRLVCYIFPRRPYSVLRKDEKVPARTDTRNISDVQYFNGPYIAEPVELERFGAVHVMTETDKLRDIRLLSITSRRHQPGSGVPLLGWHRSRFMLHAAFFSPSSCVYFHWPQRREKKHQYQAFVPRYLNWDRTRHIWVPRCTVSGDNQV